MKKTNTKAAKRKKVLAASVALGAVIIIGGTFAWFTSKDEVTNKLTASNKFGVSITESFTPTDQWVPGQEIKKEVAVVNTGNIDAFVKVSLTDALKISTISSSETAPTANAEKLSDYVTLSDDEVTSLQAGGILAYAVDSDGSAITKTVDSATVAITGSVGTDFKASDYGTGLYIFKRTNVKADNTETAEYAGYYYLAGTDGKAGTYYALNSIAANTTNGVTTFTVTYQTKKDVDPAATTWALATDEKSIQVTYDAGTADDKTDDIVINIKLADNYKNEWTLIHDDTNKNYVFYYNKLLASGATSGNIVAAVELDKDVTKDAYRDLEYNLTVNSESVQVTTDSTGKQTADSVEEWNATPSLTLDNSNKITKIAWAAKASSNTEATEATTEATTD